MLAAGRLTPRRHPALSKPRLRMRQSPALACASRAAHRIPRTLWTSPSCSRSTVGPSSQGLFGASSLQQVRRKACHGPGRTNASNGTRTSSGPRASCMRRTRRAAREPPLCGGDPKTSSLPILVLLWGPIWGPVLGHFGHCFLCCFDMSSGWHFWRCGGHLGPIFGTFWGTFLEACLNLYINCDMHENISI